MRKLIVFEFITLDGVIQAPGGTTEDTRGGFAYGGWTVPFSDGLGGATIGKLLNQPLDLLLGRKTFDNWESYWPSHGEDWPQVNIATKYVASNTRTSSDWQPTVFLNGDVAKKVAELKQRSGPELHLWGSANLFQTLYKHDLVDEFWLMIHPVTLGSGKRLFAEGTITAAYKLSESLVTPKGVIFAHYERDGDVRTGNF